MVMGAWNKDLLLKYIGFGRLAIVRKRGGIKKGWYCSRLGRGTGVFSVAFQALDC